MSRNSMLMTFLPLLTLTAGIIGCPPRAEPAYPRGDALYAADESREFNRETRADDVRWAERRVHYPYPMYTDQADGWYAFLAPKKRWQSVETHAFLRASLARDHRWADEDRRIRFEREQEDRWYGKRLLTPWPHAYPLEIDYLLDRLYGPIDEDPRPDWNPQEPQTNNEDS